MTNSLKRISTLKAAAKQKQEKTLERAQNALKEMIERNVPINFESVARYAQVSKTWLYGQNDLCIQIRLQRNTLVGKPEDKGGTDKILKKNDIIEKLKRQLTQKNSEIAQLKKQLEVVYGELYRLGNK
jgi:hypothetical protein